jgi:glycosyltransferase involved in cell wall biosynthesis
MMHFPTTKMNKIVAAKDVQPLYGAVPRRKERVVVLIPTYNSARFWPEVSERLLRLDPQPDLYIFAENNSTDKTLQLISKFNRPKEIIRLWFRDDALDFLETRFDPVAIVRQFLLQRTRQLDPDFAIFLDSDILVESEDLIPRLTRWVDRVDTPGMILVGGPYPRLLPDGKGVRVAAISGWWEDDSLPWRESLMHRPILEPVNVCGTGCMCLPRRLIQDVRLNFYPVKTSEYESEELKQILVRLKQSNVAEDVAYCYRARALGAYTALDWSVYLDHLYQGDKWRPWSAMPGESEMVRDWKYNASCLDESCPIVRLGRDAAMISEWIRQQAS